jgi:hypothetical protein
LHLLLQQLLQPLAGPLLRLFGIGRFADPAAGLGVNEPRLSSGGLCMAGGNATGFLHCRV